MNLSLGMGMAHVSPTNRKVESLATGAIHAHFTKEAKTPELAVNASESFGTTSDTTQGKQIDSSGLSERLRAFYGRSEWSKRHIRLSESVCWVGRNRVQCARKH